MGYVRRVVRAQHGGRFDRAVATANGVFEPNKFDNNLVQKELE
jgi:hypothetical protein